MEDAGTHYLFRGTFFQVFQVFQIFRERRGLPSSLNKPSLLTTHQFAFDEVDKAVELMETKDDRIIKPLILEELRSGERDLASLAKTAGLAHSSVSQHLMDLRAHRVVAERRAGRRVFYRLRSVELAGWLV